MYNDDDVESETTSNTPPTDTSDKQVESDLEDRDRAREALTKEQEAEELRRKIAEIERKVADGN